MSQNPAAITNLGKLELFFVKNERQKKTPLNFKANIIKHRITEVFNVYKIGRFRSPGTSIIFTLKE